MNYKIIFLVMRADCLLFKRIFLFSISIIFFHQALSLYNKAAGEDRLAVVSEAINDVNVQHEGQWLDVKTKKRQEFMENYAGPIPRNINDTLHSITIAETSKAVNKTFAGFSPYLTATQKALTTRGSQRDPQMRGNPHGPVEALTKENPQDTLASTVAIDTHDTFASVLAVDSGTSGFNTTETTVAENFMTAPATTNVLSAPELTPVPEPTPAPELTPMPEPTPTPETTPYQFYDDFSSGLSKWTTTGRVGVTNDFLGLTASDGGIFASLVSLNKRDPKGLTLQINLETATELTFTYQERYVTGGYHLYEGNIATSDFFVAEVHLSTGDTITLHNENLNQSNLHGQILTAGDPPAGVTFWKTVNQTILMPAGTSELHFHTRNNRPPNLDQGMGGFINYVKIN